MQRAFDAILSGLLDTLRDRQPVALKGGRRILLAVSGGIDSMCMAELFENARAAGIVSEIAVAHCNFCLRGEESDADERLVTRWAEKAGAGLYKKRFDTEGYARAEGLSIEMAARKLRYDWFYSLCLLYGYEALAVAHNANDNAETLFLNLLRGTGIKGLSGMKYVSPFPVAEASLGSGPLLIRPMLGFPRKTIEGYAFARRIAYRDDSTNNETEYKRNKLRNLVFPLFEQINPSFISTLNREMPYFSQVSGIADDYFRNRAGRFLLPGNSSLERIRISTDELMSDPHWKYLLYRVLDEYGFCTADTASLTRLLESRRTFAGKKFGTGKYEAVTASGCIVIMEKNHTPPVQLPARRRRGTLQGPDFSVMDSSSSMQVPGVGKYRFNGVSFSVETVPYQTGMSLKMPEGTLAFDRAAMDFPFLCRKWIRGDWMIPLGMKGRKKISDMFTDWKYGIPEKDGAVMITDGRSETGRVFAVLGKRLDDSLKITENTVEIIIIRIYE